MDEIAILSRFIHYVAAMFLFGTSLFVFYADPNRLKKAAQGMKLRRGLARIASCSAIVLMLSGIAWWMSIAATMGADWTDAIDPDALRAVLFDTQFGHVWLIRLAINIVAIFFFSLRCQFFGLPAQTLTLLLALVLLGSLGAVGHAMMFGGAIGAAHLVAQIIHLIAAGFWIGGLLPLAIVISQAMKSGDKAWLDYLTLAVRNFSRWGLVAVAVIFFSGSLMSLILVRHWHALFDTLYGNVLLVKLILFGAMCALALFNRLALSPNLNREKDSNVLPELLKSVAAEQILGIGILLVISVLGNLPPAFVSE